MQPKPIYDYIFFGTCLRFLQDVREGYSLKDKGFIYDNLKFFLNNLDKLDLKVTKRASYDLFNLLEKYKKKNKNYKLTLKDAKELNEIIFDVRKTLDAESEGLFNFIVTEKRMDLNKLLNNVDKLFSFGVFDKLSEIAKYDLTEAGKCVAFELPTSAAFHILRATEDTLKNFYCSVVKRNRVKVFTWGNIINSLRGKKGLTTLKTLFDNLDNIRFNFRNPTQHPESIYNTDIVQDLFGICIDVINRMITYFNDNE